MKILQQGKLKPLPHEGLKLHCQCGAIVELERHDKYEMVQHSLGGSSCRRFADAAVACPTCRKVLLFRITNDGQTITAESREPVPAGQPDSINDPAPEALNFSMPAALAFLRHNNLSFAGMTDGEIWRQVETALAALPPQPAV